MKKFIIAVLLIIILFLIFGFKDFKKGINEGFNEALKTEQSK
ncbi:hypothetical protein P3F01_03525 [Clostridium perfringens]|nr:hypothetical protein [Clostridium perfringens]MDT9335446.1 hypothetical protein [Clostridium perfringens]MDT9343203.1 hypothetical protein [Clostridium perfringens]MDT9346384.1 hypothetical protein [Clostridium perfringens]MDT9352289.1 hypothetical protein [Clostridium perfringens]